MWQRLRPDATNIDAQPQSEKRLMHGILLLN
jgi:hypothetical protein